MEWDQISKKWVAMTQRLRNDCPAPPRTIDRLKSVGLTPKAVNRNPKASMPPEMSGGDHSLNASE